MVTERKFKEQEVQIARYRLLEREVTDPLAASLLYIIVSELEADPQADRETSTGYPSAAPASVYRSPLA
jgi:hypothetical protein